MGRQGFADAGFDGLYATFLALVGCELVYHLDVLEGEVLYNLVFLEYEWRFLHQVQIGQDALHYGSFQIYFLTVYFLLQQGQL